MGPFGPPREPNIPVMGVSNTMTSDGTLLSENIIELEATILTHRGPNAERMTPWVRTQAAIRTGNCLSYPYGVPRLDGPFLRSQLFTGTAPTLLTKMTIANSVDDLALPRRDLAKRPPGPIKAAGVGPPPPGRPVVGPLTPAPPGLPRVPKKSPPAAPGVSP